MTTGPTSPKGPGFPGVSTTEAACRLFEGDRLPDIVAAARFAGMPIDVDAVFAEIDVSAGEWSGWGPTGQV
jgi:hypothetical protein